MDITYTKCGDYYIPNIALSDTAHYHIGKYGRMRRTFLMEWARRMNSIKARAEEVILAELVYAD